MYLSRLVCIVSYDTYIFFSRPVVIRLSLSVKFRARMHVLLHVIADTLLQGIEQVLWRRVISPAFYSNCLHPSVSMYVCVVDIEVLDTYVRTCPLICAHEQKGSKRSSTGKCSHTQRPNESFSPTATSRRGCVVYVAGDNYVCSPSTILRCLSATINEPHIDARAVSHSRHRFASV